LAASINNACEARIKSGALSLIRVCSGTHSRRPNCFSGRRRLLVVCARPVEGGNPPSCCSDRRWRCRCRLGIENWYHRSSRDVRGITVGLGETNGVKVVKSSPAPCPLSPGFFLTAVWCSAVRRGPLVARYQCYLVAPRDCSGCFTIHHSNTPPVEYDPWLADCLSQVNGIVNCWTTASTHRVVCRREEQQ